jgi:hypothetical protein
VGKNKIKTWKQEQIMCSNSDKIIIDMKSDWNNKLVSRYIVTKEELHFQVKSVIGSSLK